MIPYKQYKDISAINYIMKIGDSCLPDSHPKLSTHHSQLSLSPAPPLSRPALLKELERKMARQKEELLRMVKTVEQRDERWRRVIEEKLKENKSVNEQLAQSQKQAFYQSQIDSLKDQLVRLRRQSFLINQSLLAFAHESQSLRKRFQASKSQLERTLVQTRKARTLTASNNEQLSVRCREMQGRVRVLEEKCKEKGEQLQERQKALQLQKEGEKSGYMAEEQALKSMLGKSESLQKSLSALQLQFKSLSDQSYHKGSLVSALKDDLQRKASLLHQKQAKAIQLRSQLEQVKTVEVDILKLQQTLQLEQQGLKASESNFSKLRLLIQESQSQLLEKRRTSKLSTQALEERRTEMGRELQQEESRMEREQKKIKQSKLILKELQEDLQQERQTIQGLKCAIQVPASKANQHSLMAMEKELSKLSSARAELESRGEALAGELKEVQAQQQQYTLNIAALQTQISSYKDKLQKTNTQLQQITSKYKKINSSLEEKHRLLFLSVYHILFVQEPGPELATDIEKVVIAVQQKLQKQLGGAIRKKKPLELLKKNKNN